MEIKETIIKSLAEVADSDAEKINLEPTSNQEFGDYTSNIAFTSFQKDTFKNPREYAEILKAKLIENEELRAIVDKVDIAGPGFINFFLKKEVLFDTLVYISSHKDSVRYSNKFKDQKVIIEFTDPNPFKEFHVGHLYSNTVGESICRLYESLGGRVLRGNYFGDVGMHVAKAIWGLMHMFDEQNSSLNELATKPLKERIEYFGKAYSLGATAYEEDENAKEDMKSLNFLIFKSAQEVVLPQFKENPQVNYDQFVKANKYKYEDVKEMYAIGREWSMAYFETIYDRVGVKFEGYFPESRTGEFGYGMVMDGLEKGIFEKGDGGAIIFPGKKYGLHNRVFINALGLPTYETKDFGNAVVKYKDFPYDKSIIITGNEINDYFVVVLKALSLSQKKLADVTKHIGHGMVRLPEGKISSRTGKIIRGEWVLDEAKKRSLEITNKNEDFVGVDSEKEVITEMVAQGAVKYAFLKQGIGNDISFDFETSLSFDGNSGPYLQYTYARCQSVINKAKITNYKLQITNENSLNLNNEELILLRTFVHFSEVVEEAAIKYSPNLLCNYLYDLAQKYNGFYNKHRILEHVDSEDHGTRNTEHGKQLMEFRLALTFATGEIIKKGLNLLGIKSPEHM